MTLESQSYCTDGSKTLKFYVNNQPSNEFDNHVIKDLDKILVSYGDEDGVEIGQQLNSITNLAPKYSSNK